MSLFLSNRDGGLTDEQGHYRFQTNVWSGHVIGNGLQVTQNSPLGMSVIVGPGDARVPYADYAYTAWNDANEVVAIATANPSNPRIDRLVLYIDRGETPQQVNPNNPGIPKFAVVAGTPAAVPVRPSNSTVDSAVGASNPWIDLADIRVNAGVTQITNSNITDTKSRVKSSSSGFHVENVTISGTGNLTISGVPFQPVGFLVFLRGSGGPSLAQAAFGASDGTTTGSTSSAASTSDSNTGSTSRVIRTIRGDGVIAVEASLVSINTDGITINVTTFTGAGNYDDYTFVLFG